MSLSFSSPIRYLSPTSKQKLGSIILQCYVYPNASRQSPSTISFASGSAVKVYLSVPAKDNKANIALVEVLSKALRWPKTDITIIHGDRSRQKALSFEGVDAKGDENAVIEMFLERLKTAAAPDISCPK